MIDKPDAHTDHSQNLRSFFKLVLISVMFIFFNQVLLLKFKEFDCFFVYNVNVNDKFNRISSTFEWQVSRTIFEGFFLDRTIFFF